MFEVEECWRKRFGPGERTRGGEVDVGLCVGVKRMSKPSREVEEEDKRLIEKSKRSMKWVKSEGVAGEFAESLSPFPLA